MMWFSTDRYKLLKHKTVIKMAFCDLKPAKTYWLAALMGGGEADYTGRESSPIWRVIEPPNSKKNRACGAI